MRSGPIRTNGLVRLLAAAILGLPAIASADTPTFSKDVAPILFTNCATCHRAGEIGPMPLTSFVEARPWARAIKLAVTSRTMPPWGADPAVGHFANDPRLTQKDLDTITAWADGGAPEGNPRDLPALPAFAAGWQIGTPDVVLTSAPFDVSPTGRSVYNDASLPTSFGADKFVRETEVRLGAPSITHHANAYVQEPGGRARVASYSPGTGGKAYPDGVAKLIPAGTTLILNMHYNPKGQPGHDPGTRVGLKFATGPIRQVAITDDSSNNAIDIPPGDANYELAGKPFVFAEDSHLLTFTPRMNERGKDITYTLVRPDGSRQVLLRVPKFSYAWVFTYVLAEPIAAPKGSRLETLAHFDNSAANRNNPDPTARVKFGPEILNAYFEYTLDGQDLSRSTAAPRR
jgi:hypothetical protein